MDSIKIPAIKDEEDAKRKAKDCLIQLFENKMLNIDTIKGHIAEYHKHESQNSIEIFNKIERNINELEVSLKKIDKVIENIQDVNDKHEKFLRCWEKITSPLNYYGKNLENLMLSKKNVSLMTHNLDIYVKVKDQIKELREILDASDSNIVLVYKQVRYLTYLRNVLLEKVKTVSRSDKLNNLADHFLCVGKFEVDFFEKFWRYFQGTVQLATERPEFLVKLLRLVEEDADYMNSIKSIFKMYNKSDEKFSGLEPSIRDSSRDVNCDRDMLLESSDSLSDTVKKKITGYITENVHNRFLEKQSLEEILEETLNLTAELYTVQTKVVPCFPQKYDIFNLYKDNYLTHIYEKITPFLNQDELEKSPGLLIPLARWLDQFDESLKRVGMDINATEIAGSVTYYMHLFFDHVNEILQSSVKTVLDKNQEDKLKLKNDKKIDLEKIQSFYATDIFGSLLNVIDPLSGDVKGQLLLQIIKIVVEKLQEIQRENDIALQNLNCPEELIVSCVYVLDASRCIEIFPSFKKKIKSILSKEYYDHLKLRYFSSSPSVLSMFNNTIRLGCSKAIQLMFLDLEKTYLRKLFTNEWDNDVVEGIFGAFREYFNKGFYKVLKSQTNLLIIVRAFIDNFVCFYIEEMIHSIRSLNRKLLKSSSSELAKYELVYLTFSPDDIVYQVKNDTEKKNEEAVNRKGTVPKDNTTSPIQAVKALDKYVDTKKEEKTKFKKYNFPVKKFNQQSKKYNPITILKRIFEDKELFVKFLNSFREGAAEPFSKNFTQTLGNNYIKTFVDKFLAILDILKCHQNALKETINNTFKDSFLKEDGKALLEALLYVREDYAAVTKPDMKHFYLSSYDK